MYLPGMTPSAPSKETLENINVCFDSLEEDASTFQVLLDSVIERACHCVDKIVLAQECELDQVFFNPRADLLSSEGMNHSSRAPSELEYVTPPLGTIMPLHPVSDDEMGEVTSSSGPCACSVPQSSDQENECPASPLVEVPQVPLDPIDLTIVMRQDQVVRRVEALGTKLHTHVSQSGHGTYQGC